MSFNASSGKSQSTGPVAGYLSGLARLLANSGKLDPNKELPAYTGVPSAFDPSSSEGDLYTALLGGAPSTSPVAGAGQTVKQLLETGAPVDTTAFENSLDTVRSRTLAEESANLQERSGLAGSRFSTGYLNQQGELSRKSLQDYMATVAPLRYQAGENAQARRQAILQKLYDVSLGRQSIRQNAVQMSLADQRARELGYLPYIIQLLGSAQNQSSARQYAIGGGGKGGGGGAITPCWVADALYGVGSINATRARYFAVNILPLTWYGRILLTIYRRVGRWIARHNILCQLLRPLFNLML